MANTWRERLKSGALSGLYQAARHIKRRIRNEPLAGTLVVPQIPMEEAALRLLARGKMAAHARVQFSLGLAYLEARTPSQDRKALACLRAADALDFESPERTRLYRALIASRNSRVDEAMGLIASLSAIELTSEELAVLEGIQSGTFPALIEDSPVPESVWTGLDPILPANDSLAILILDDSEAVSAGWMMQRQYLLAAESVTGLDLDAVKRTQIRFSVGYGPATRIEQAIALGITCDEWRPIDGMKQCPASP